MDGYAVRAADTAGATRDTPVRLRCVEQVYTGQMPVQVVATGLCSEVATGAPMPEGADAVVMVEETAANGDAVQLLAAAAAGQNIGRQGQDIRQGQLVLSAGTVLSASRVGAIAALGHTDVLVHAQPRVAILSTGNEVVAPGEPLAPGQIYDINSSTLAAGFAEHGGVPVIHRTAVDTLEDLSRAVDDCLAEDVLVFSGGSLLASRPGARRRARKGECSSTARRSLASLRPSPRGGKLAFGMRATHVVPDQRLHAARAVLRRLGHLEQSAARSGCRSRRAWSDAGPAPVLHGARRAGPRPAGVQGLRRHH